MIREEMIFRAVRGACENAATAHPNWIMDPRLPRSVAKRATGTLAALQRQSLAALQAPSEKRDDEFVHHLANVVGFPHDDIASAVTSDGKRPADLAIRRAWRPFRRTLRQMISQADVSGENVRATALRDALSLFDAALNRHLAGKIDP